MKSLSFLYSFFAVSVTAQTTPYTDPRTQITYQAFSDPSGYTFGISLPSSPTTDFTGLLIGLKDGWAGISLGGSMVGKLLIAAWPNGNQVISSFRKATAYSPPPRVTGAYSINPVLNGTYVNETHFALTFQCKGCILKDGTTFAAGDTNTYLGWALSSTLPAATADPAARLQYHDIFGQYGVDLIAARPTSSPRHASRAPARRANQLRPSFQSAVSKNSKRQPVIGLSRVSKAAEKHAKRQV
ncbi:hypothetical protein B0O99DRAFT_589187 [Bisporella sp. PMI_857]|nr:hypothetical protein B0O99DRAFT_589187 [Bisporella sp. PMI_857]